MNQYEFTDTLVCIRNSVPSELGAIIIPILQRKAMKLRAIG